ncbi:MAG: cytochrome ubiquinol oxidase subunit I [Gemmatimonadales bacterium]
MSELMFARSQMAMSLAFHIVFAALGVGMPLLMAIAEGAYLRTREPTYLDLSRRWATGTAVLFAVGAVSGTVLSFELGLLWPSFMAHAGAIIGMPFSLEGFAFFTEAIFIGVYLYGWDRLPPRIHWLAGVIVAASGVLSSAFVVTANAWMNAPTGFRVANGTFTDIDPIAAMLNPASLHEVVHMTLAAFTATGFAVAAVHAWFLRRDRTSGFHRRALGIALTVACISIPLQILSGDLSARAVGRLQPAKLAAMEAHYITGAGVPLLIGGIPDDSTRTVAHAIHIPVGLSLLLTGDPGATITGLDHFPEGDWPDVRVVHWAFDLMVAAGMALLAVAAWTLWLRVTGRPLVEQRTWLGAVVLVGPLGFVAIEAGWAVTEVGRQPWIIYNVMRTADAVTPMPGLVVPFVAFTALYVFLAFVVVVALRRQFLETRSGGTKAGTDA